MLARGIQLCNMNLHVRGGSFKEVRQGYTVQGYTVQGYTV